VIIGLSLRHVTYSAVRGYVRYDVLAQRTPAAIRTVESVERRRRFHPLPVCAPEPKFYNTQYHLGFTAVSRRSTAWVRYLTKRPSAHGSCYVHVLVCMHVHERKGRCPRDVVETISCRPPTRVRDERPESDNCRTGAENL